SGRQLKPNNFGRASRSPAIGPDVAQRLSVMSLIKLRTFALVAGLVALQAPAMFAIDGEKPPKPHRKVDKQIEQSADDAMAVIVRAGSKKDWSSLLATLHKHHLDVDRIAPQSNAISLSIASSDLAWLEAQPEVASISSDAPVMSAPVSALATLTNTGGGLIKKSELRAVLGLTDSDPTGNGVGIAIIDSGIAPVSDLTSRITAFYDFSDGKRGLWTPPTDGYGHGTHVAGLIA